MSSFDVVIINEIVTCDDDGQCEDDDDKDHNDHKLGEDNDDHVVYCTVTLLLVLIRN